MKFRNILSLRSIITFGFVISVIPLFLAVMYAAFAMRETASLGRAMNLQVFEQTKAVRLVLQKSSDVERKARLFVLLADPSLRQPYERQSYEGARASFKQALNSLLKLQVDNKIALLANELAEKEDLIYQQIIGAEPENSQKLPLDEAFQRLRESSSTLSREFENHVEHAFNELRQQSDSLEQGLLTKGAVLLSISFAFMAALLAMLSRSMRQLDASIRRLGAGGLSEPVAVTGPSDLRFLGTRLEWLRTHLLELEVSKRQFMRNVAQEIETPLQTLRDGVGLLVEEEDKPVRQDIAPPLHAALGKLQTVADELARHSQDHAAPAAQRKEAVNLNDLLESVAADFQPRLEAKSLALKKLARPVEVVGVPGQLRDMLGQLLANAVKFSPTGGEIRVMLRASGRHMELEVEDEGPGIDPDERAQAFEPFFRGRAAQAAASEGPGLGLALVSEYVANHRGKVEIVEPRLDQNGARIRVQIPLTDED